MELYQLKCFLAAADSENFSRAAEKVHTSQSSISKIIARLEEEVGVPLFDRSKGHITLNSNGVIFQKYVTMSLQDLQQGIDILALAADAQKHSVLIGCTASQRFDSILEEIQADNPQCKLEIQVSTLETVLKAFESGTLDIGFVESDYTFDSELFEQIDYQYFVVMMNEKHPIGNVSSFPEKQINDEIVCFTGNVDDRRFLMHMFAAKGLKPKVFAEYTDHKATAQLINMGMAIGIAPDELVYHRKLATPRVPLRAVPISKDWHRIIYMMKRRDSNEEVNKIYKDIRIQLLKERQLIREFYQKAGISLEEVQQ